MSATRINVGGKEFVASRSTWAKSPVLDMILRRSAEPVPFVDRNPDVFKHVLDWMRQGRLYIDRPVDVVYKQLCDDADFYGLEDLSRFLANRINLCSFIYFEHNGRRTRCNLDAFRTLEPADGFIDRLLAGDRDTLARLTFVDADTVLLDIDLTKCCNALLRPHMRWPRCCYWDCSDFRSWKMFFGSRFAIPDSYYYDYNPVLRAEPKD